MTELQACVRTSICIMALRAVAIFHTAMLLQQLDGAFSFPHPDPLTIPLDPWQDISGANDIRLETLTLSEVIKNPHVQALFNSFKDASNQLIQGTEIQNMLWRQNQQLQAKIQSMRVGCTGLDVPQCITFFFSQYLTSSVQQEAQRSPWRIHHTRRLHLTDFELFELGIPASYEAG